jgi:hypothetical protein
MILDGALLFDSAAAITAASGTQASTNVLDLLNARDMGIGDKPSLKILSQVIAAFAGGTSVAVALQGSTDNTTFTTMLASAALTLGSLTAGSRIFDVDVPRPVPGQAVPRYLRLLYTTVGTHTLGTVTSGIVLDRQDQISYPAGINIAN